MQVIKYVFQPHGDDRGQLVALEEFKDIPFEIKRVYYMYDTSSGVTRGYHAHKKLEQISHLHPRQLQDPSRQRDGKESRSAGKTVRRSLCRQQHVAGNVRFLERCRFDGAGVPAV